MRKIISFIHFDVKKLSLGQNEWSMKQGTLDTWSQILSPPQNRCRWLMMGVMTRHIFNSFDRFDGVINLIELMKVSSTWFVVFSVFLYFPFFSTYIEITILSDTFRTKPVSSWANETRPIPSKESLKDCPSLGSQFSTSGEKKLLDRLPAAVLIMRGKFFLEIFLDSA